MGEFGSLDGVNRSLALFVMSPTRFTLQSLSPMNAPLTGYAGSVSHSSSLSTLIHNIHSYSMSLSVFSLSSLGELNEFWLSWWAQWILALLVSSMDCSGSQILKLSKVVLSLECSSSVQVYWALNPQAQQGCAEPWLLKLSTGVLSLTSTSSARVC